MFSLFRRASGEQGEDREDKAAMAYNEAKINASKTYNSRDSLVVTHPTTNRPACGLNAVKRSVGAPVARRCF
jgi:hypothetical protein